MSSSMHFWYKCILWYNATFHLIEIYSTNLNFHFLFSTDHFFSRLSTIIWWLLSFTRACLRDTSNQILFCPSRPPIILHARLHKVQTSFEVIIALIHDFLNIHTLLQAAEINGISIRIYRRHFTTSLLLW